MNLFDIYRNKKWPGLKFESKKFNEVLDQLNEAFSQWEYNIPEDKEKLMFDFYMMINLPIPIDENLKIALEEGKEKLVNYLKESHLKAISFAIAAEFRHIFDDKAIKKNNSEILNYFTNIGYKKFIIKYIHEYFGLKSTPNEFWTDDFVDSSIKNRYKKDDKNYKASFNAVLKSGIPMEEFIQLARAAFNNFIWKKMYGGKKWAEICDGWLNLNNTNTLNDKIIWIDYVYDLQHNTNTVFNKLKSYYKDGYKWIKEALDKKKYIKNIYEIIDDISPILYRFAAAVIKNVKGTDIESWLIKNSDKKLSTKEINIREWLKKFKASDNVTQNSDGTWNCSGNIDLSEMNLTRLPLKFGKVSGYFWCHNNSQLTSLEGAPKEVDGDFWCSHNQLTSLEGSPKKVRGSFLCYDNPGPNGNGFTKEEVRDICDVKGTIYV